MLFAILWFISSLYLECDRASGLWQQLNLAHKIESDLQGTVGSGLLWVSRAVGFLSWLNLFYKDNVKTMLHHDYCSDFLFLWVVYKLYTTLVRGLLLVPISCMIIKVSMWTFFWHSHTLKIFDYKNIQAGRQAGRHIHMTGKREQLVRLHEKILVIELCVHWKPLLC